MLDRADAAQATGTFGDGPQAAPSLSHYNSDAKSSSGVVNLSACTSRTFYSGCADKRARAALQGKFGQHPV